jgi:hypothetical protein
MIGAPTHPYNWILKLKDTRTVLLTTKSQPKLPRPEKRSIASFDCETLRSTSKLPPPATTASFYRRLRL